MSLQRCLLKIPGTWDIASGKTHCCRVLQMLFCDSLNSTTNQISSTSTYWSCDKSLSRGYLRTTWWDRYCQVQVGKTLHIFIHIFIYLFILLFWKKVHISLTLKRSATGFPAGPDVLLPVSNSNVLLERIVTCRLNDYYFMLSAYGGYGCKWTLS